MHACAGCKLFGLFFVFPSSAKVTDVANDLRLLVLQCVIDVVYYLQIRRHSDPIGCFCRVNFRK
jgi:hypothetical protein